MARRQFDLPFANDGSGRFLPWMIALMVYLASLATVAALTTREVVESWNAGLEDTATVEIAPGPDAAATDGLVAQAIAVLRNTPGVAAADPVPIDEIGRLLEPWLGPDAARENLPIPRLIDVRFDPGAVIDVAALSRALLAAVPSARFDSHGLWLDRLTALGDSVQLAALVIVVLIALAAGATVVFATRAGLAVHAKLIELMHLIGSRDSYIARQFQLHAMSLALRGGVVGVLIGALTLGALTVMWRPIQEAVLPDLTIGATALVALALLPLLAAAIATLTARITVMRALKQMT